MPSNTQSCQRHGSAPWRALGRGPIVGLGQSLAPFWLLCYSTRLSLFLGAEPTRETSRGPSLIAKAPQSSQEPPPRQEPPWGLRSQELPHQPACNGERSCKTKAGLQEEQSICCFPPEGWKKGEEDSRHKKQTRDVRNKATQRSKLSHRLALHPHGAARFQLKRLDIYSAASLSTEPLCLASFWLTRMNGSPG